MSLEITVTDGQLLLVLNGETLEGRIEREPIESA